MCRTLAGIANFDNRTADARRIPIGVHYTKEDENEQARFGTVGLGDIYICDFFGLSHLREHNVACLSSEYEAAYGFVFNTVSGRARCTNCRPFS